MQSPNREKQLAAASSVVRRDGFVVLPGWLTHDEIAEATSRLDDVFPEPSAFHEAPAAHPTLVGDPFAGQRELPFASPALSLLALNESLIDLAEAILHDTDLRLYAGEAWAKYTGAASYEQEHHRDNHSLLVPSNDETCKQVELFVLLSDVQEGDGPPAFVPRGLTESLPNERHAYEREEHPYLYDNEVLGIGPAGTVIAFRADTVHRATELTRPGGARFSLHSNFRSASNGWFSRHAWGDRSYQDHWNEFVMRANYRQLLLLGFPPRGHRYWTDDTLQRMRNRYPGLDLDEWVAALPSE